MFLNKRAASPIKLIFTSLLFIILWAMFLGKWLILIGYDYITQNSSTGVEALFMANLNFIVLIAFILSIGLYGVFGGGN
jgi:hypothetical protein